MAGQRAARQRAAEAGLAGTTVGLAWRLKLNLTTTVKIEKTILLLAQRDQELAKLNGQTVEDVRRIVKACVRLGESPQFEAIRSGVEVLKANQSVTRADNACGSSRGAGYPDGRITGSSLRLKESFKPAGPGAGNDPRAGR